MRQGKYNVVVWNRQDIFYPGLDPLSLRYALTLGAMPVSARIERLFDMAAPVALVDMVAVGFGPTVSDASYNAILLLCDFVIGKIFFRIQPEDICHFI
jgi:hypothetical protein